jgi:phosphate transport system ATP-binding protein
MTGAHVTLERVTVTCGPVIVLDDVSLDVPRGGVFGIIGPARSGKSTLLRCINRLVDTADGLTVHGRVLVGGRDVFAMREVCDLRRRVGMVLPLPVGLPLSIYDNVAFAPRLAGLRGRAALDALVEDCLRRAALWDEVKDRLRTLATLLSGGQQQRLTIARALSHRPEILCLDEFSIAIDPVATMKIEDALRELSHSITIIVVTNLIQQARRLSDRVAFLNAGRIVEAGPTSVLFSEAPASPLTRAYISGAFG